MATALKRLVPSGVTSALSSGLQWVKAKAGLNKGVKISPQELFKCMEVQAETTLSKNRPRLYAPFHYALSSAVGTARNALGNSITPEQNAAAALPANLTGTIVNAMNIVSSYAFYKGAKKTHDVAGEVLGAIKVARTSADTLNNALIVPVRVNALMNGSNTVSEVAQVVNKIIAPAACLTMSVSSLLQIAESGLQLHEMYKFSKSLEDIEKPTEGAKFALSYMSMQDSDVVSSEATLLKRYKGLTKEKLEKKMKDAPAYTAGNEKEIGFSETKFEDFCRGLNSQMGVGVKDKLRHVYKFELANRLTGKRSILVRNVGSKAFEILEKNKEKIIADPVLAKLWIQEAGKVRTKAIVFHTLAIAASLIFFTLGIMDFLLSGGFISGSVLPLVISIGYALGGFIGLLLDGAGFAEALKQSGIDIKDIALKVFIMLLTIGGIVALTVGTGGIAPAVLGGITAAIWACSMLYSYYVAHYKEPLKPKVA